MSADANVLNHKGIDIEVTPASVGLSSYNGFGWVYLPKSPTDNLPIFVLVLRCDHAPYNDEQPKMLSQLGYRLVQNRLDNKDYEVEGYYCYWWTEREGAVEMDCPKVTQSPMRFTANPPQL